MRAKAKYFSDEDIALPRAGRIEWRDEFQGCSNFKDISRGPITCPCGKKSSAVEDNA